MTYLIHYGVKGMKWGVRKDRRKAKNIYREQTHEAKITRDIATMTSSKIASLKRKQSRHPEKSAEYDKKIKDSERFRDAAVRNSVSATLAATVAKQYVKKKLAISYDDYLTLMYPDEQSWNVAENYIASRASSIVEGLKDKYENR